MFSLYGDIIGSKKGIPADGGESGGGDEEGKGTGNSGRSGSSAAAWARSSNKLFAQPALLMRKKKVPEPVVAAPAPRTIPSTKRVGQTLHGTSGEETNKDSTRTEIHPAMTMMVAGRGGDGTDNYDPLKPNDYEVVLDERMRRQACLDEENQRRRSYSDEEEEMEEEEDRRDSRYDREESDRLYEDDDRDRRYKEDVELRSGRVGERKERVSLSISGEEAYNRRAQLSRRGDERERNEREETNRRDEARISGAEAYERRAQLSISGEEAYLQRAQKRPRRNATPPDEQRRSYEGRNHDRLRPSSPPIRSSVPTLESGGSIAAAMMASMGWTEGTGLGKDGQGITEALHAKAPKGRGGIGTFVDEDLEPLKSVRVEKHAGKKISANSRVLLLTNMVGPGEVDAELETETAEECTKYGRVEGCVVYEVADEDVEDKYAVRIFVKFLEPEAASRALLDLDGRLFAGRRVRASFFPEEKYNLKQFASDSNHDD